jgi:hypothetical protein
VRIPPASSSTPRFRPKPLRAGTLLQILKDLASQMGWSIEELLGSLDL